MPAGPYEPTYTPVPAEHGPVEEAADSPPDLPASELARDLELEAPPPAPPPPPPSSSSSGSSSGRKRNSAWAEAAPPALHVGRVVGDRWRVSDRIGMGGMAAVHEGFDLRLERKVAVKILHPHISESADARTRLAREARAIAQLKHENVIEVYDYSIDDPDCTWLVTELIEGQSLRHALDKSPRPMPEVAAMITYEIVRALGEAHEVGVVHRDVKPDNILIGKNGRPKLSDFGIAQIVGEERMTLTGNLVGSPSYMSPEQAEGRRTDHRTDLFSAGTVLYRLVTGVLPFTGENAIETLRRVSRGEYVDPTEIEPACPATIAGVIRKALSPNMDERYQSADEMLEDLYKILHDGGLLATWQELPRWFSDATAYESELKPRLARELAARGRVLLDAGDEARALDCMSRATTLGMTGEQTLDLARALSKRRERTKRRPLVLAVSAAFAIAAVVGGALAMTNALDPVGSVGATIAGAATGARPEATIATSASTPPRAPAAAAPAPAPSAVTPAVPAPAPPPAAAPPAPAVQEDPPRRASAPSPPKPRPARPAVAPAERPKIGMGVLHLGTKVWVDIYVNGVKLGQAPATSKYTLPEGTHRLKAVNPNCNPVEKLVTITADQTTKVPLEVVCP